MAGYVVNRNRPDVVFHFGVDIALLRSASENTRVMLLQVDGDELEAVLWGIRNYKKIVGVDV